VDLYYSGPCASFTFRRARRICTDFLRKHHPHRLVFETLPSDDSLLRGPSAGCSDPIPARQVPDTMIGAEPQTTFFYQAGLEESRSLSLERSSASFLFGSFNGQMGGSRSSHSRNETLLNRRYPRSITSRSFISFSPPRCYSVFHRECEPNQFARITSLDTIRRQVPLETSTRHTDCLGRRSADDRRARPGVTP
jgi:hypothetical protein